MEILSSRVHVSARDFAASRRFYEGALGLAVYREYGSGGTVSGVVYFAGGGFLELGQGSPTGISLGQDAFLWWQVADVAATHAELVERGVKIEAPPTAMPWGLVEMWIRDPDEVRIAIVEVPPEHPLRRRVD